MLLYHGSTVVVEAPEVDRNQTEAIDFGAELLFNHQTALERSGAVILCP